MKTQVLIVIEKIASKKVEKELKDGPPFCIGFFHQPVRPEKRSKQQVKAFE